MALTGSTAAEVFEAYIEVLAPSLEEGWGVAMGKLQTYKKTERTGEPVEGRG